MGISNDYVGQIYVYILLSSLLLCSSITAVMYVFGVIFKDRRVVKQSLLLNLLLVFSIFLLHVWLYIPVIFQVASLLAVFIPVSMLPGICSLAVAMHLEIHRV